MVKLYLVILILFSNGLTRVYSQDHQKTIDSLTNNMKFGGGKHHITIEELTNNIKNGVQIISILSECETCEDGSNYVTYIKNLLNSYEDWKYNYQANVEIEAEAEFYFKAGLMFVSDSICNQPAKLWFELAKKLRYQDNRLDSLLLINYYCNSKELKVSSEATKVKSKNVTRFDTIEPKYSRCDFQDVLNYSGTCQTQKEVYQYIKGVQTKYTLYFYNDLKIKKFEDEKFISGKYDRMKTTWNHKGKVTKRDKHCAKGYWIINSNKLFKRKKISEKEYLYSGISIL
jgi:hypothetical protein